MKQELVIDFKDLILHILLKWRQIIIFMIIFSIGFNGIALLKSYKEVNNWEKQKNDTEETYLSNYASNLSDQEKEEVENVFKSYLAYQESYNNSLEYYNDSIWMHLDPTEVDTIEIQYYLEGTKKVADIVETYKLSIDDESLCQKIIESLGWETETSYIKELITIEDSSDNEITLNQNVENLENFQMQHLMTLHIVAPNKEDCEKIADIIDAAIEQKKQNIQKIYGNYNLEKVEEVYYKDVDNELMQSQQSFVTSLRSMKEAINSLKVNFTVDQNNYYKALIENNDNSEKSEAGINNNNSQQTDIQSPTIQLISIKYIVLGALIGAFFSVFIVFIKYISSRKLKSKNELTDSFGIEIIGCFDDKKLKSKKFGSNIDYYLKKIFTNTQNIISEEEMMKLVCMVIDTMAEKENMKKIHIAGAANTTECNQVKTQINNNLSLDKCNISQGGFVVSDTESLKNLLESDGVIFVEQIEKSYYADIQQEIKLCKKYNIPIMGSIIIQ